MASIFQVMFMWCLFRLESPLACWAWVPSVSWPAEGLGSRRRDVFGCRFDLGRREVQLNSCSLFDSCHKSLSSAFDTARYARALLCVAEIGEPG